MFLWKVTNRIHPSAWLNYRLLNQATNNKSSEKFHSTFFISRKKLKKPEWHNSDIFPNIKEPDINKINECLKKDGLYIFEDLIPQSLLDSILEYAKTKEAILCPPPKKEKTRAIFDPHKPLSNGYQFNEAEMLQYPVFQHFLGDPVVLSISQAYLGVEPKHRGLLLWWSTVFSKNPSCEMAQLFHADLAHIKWLKFFIYLTDVTKDTGPHSFVKGSHLSDQQGKEIRSRGLTRIPDEDIYNQYGKENVIDLIGPRGTVFVADTRGFHKGHLPKDDHRLVLQLYLVSSLYPDVGKHDWKISLQDPVLIESIKKHPKVFDAYNIDTKI